MQNVVIKKRKDEQINELRKALKTVKSSFITIGVYSY